MERRLIDRPRYVLSYKMVFQRDLRAYANDTPPIVNELISKIRILDPVAISTSMLFDAGEESIDTLYLEGRLAEAEQRAREQVHSRPSDVNIRVTLSILLGLQGKLDEAKEQALSAHQIEPENVTVLGRLGTAEQQLGNYREAIKALKHAIAIDPLKTSAMQDLSVCYRKLGRLDLAWEIESKLRAMGG